MTSVLVLDDGRALHESNLGYSTMLEMISREVCDEHGRLRSWLVDIAYRPTPHCEFDTRGLDELDRKEFWAAAERALASKIDCDGPECSWPANSYGARALVRLLQMHLSIRSGEPPTALNELGEVFEFDGVQENLDEIWGRNDT
jgi:hypothetical protein